MSCYVDRLRSFGWVMYGKQVQSCHLIADTLEELHTFAAKIGMKQEWFQNKASLPHYDLVPVKRAWAVHNGAIELEDKPFVEKMRELKAKRRGA